MPTMSMVEKAFCRSAPWRVFTRHIVLPWALQATEVRGDVLEIGAGSGAMAEQLLATTPAITMCATDFDPAMVWTSARRLARFGDRASARQADGTALPFADSSFDTVLSWIMLHHTMAWENALREAVRVLRPGGWLIGYDLVGTRATQWFHRGEDTGHHMVSVNELEAGLARLAVVDASVRPSRGRVVMRFKARRTPTPGG